MKKITGIKTASCETCVYLSSEDDGNFAEFAISWSVCRKNKNMENLKGFPFKSDVKCWEPEFWHSNFTDMIKTGSDAEVHAALDAFAAARDQFISLQ